MNSPTEQSRRQSETGVWSLIAAVAWALFILGLCTVPGEDLPTVDVISADKIGHFGVFAILGWLWMRSWPPSDPRRRLKQVLLAGFAYAVLTEAYQGLVPIGRMADIWDAVANSGGLFAGAGLYRYLTYRTSSRIPAGASDRV